MGHVPRRSLLLRGGMFDMLTGNEAANPGPAQPGTDSVPSPSNKKTNTIPTRLERVFCIEWIGQTVASVCWISSVLAYGITSTGDWLQLAAASAWLIANIAAAITIKAD